MVIEKFLALSMIALGLAASASAADKGQPEPVRPDRGGRRRVRWLRQHLPPRGSTGRLRSPRPTDEVK